mgnify:CR=1 FL=1
MARPALPKNIHVLKGTAKKDPQRMRARENEPENKNPLGKPSDYLNELQKEFFNEIVSDSIEGVLGEADRLAVEQASILLWKCRNLNIIDGDIVQATAAEQSQFFKYLSQFGMTPADRSKISIPKQKEKNRFDD